MYSHPKCGSLIKDASGQDIWIKEGIVSWIGLYLNSTSLGVGEVMVGGREGDKGGSRTEGDRRTRQSVSSM